MTKSPPSHLRFLTRRIALPTLGLSLCFALSNCRRKPIDNEASENENKKAIELIAQSVAQMQQQASEKDELIIELRAALDAKEEQLKVQLAEAESAGKTEEIVEIKKEQEAIKVEAASLKEMEAVAPRAKPLSVPKTASAESIVLAPPDPTAKFMGVEKFLKRLPAYDSKAKLQAYWGGIYSKVEQDFEPADYQDKQIVIPILLGIRIADGLACVMVRDAEALGNCADDIEKLAKKIGVADSDLRYARQARRAADKGEWGRVFSELGFLRLKVMQTLRSLSNERRTLIQVGGWMQSLRLAAKGIEDMPAAAKDKALNDRGLTINHPSYHLREPVMARDLAIEVGKLPAGTLSSPALPNLRKHLSEIFQLIDIPSDPSDSSARLSDEQVKRLYEMADEIVAATVRTKG